MNRFFLVWFTLLIAVFASESRCQSISEFDQKQIDAIEKVFQKLVQVADRNLVYIGPDGKTHYGMLFLQKNPTLDSLDFYQCKVVKQNLNLTGDQPSDYDQIIEKWNSHRERINIRTNQVRKSGRGEKSLQSDKKKYLASEKDSVRRINRLLKPAQRLRLSQLKAHFLVQKVGIYQFFQSQEIQNLLSLSKRDLALLKKRFQNKNQLGAWILAARNKAVELLLESLTEEDQQAIKEIWPILVKEKQFCSAGFRIQLLNADQHEYIRELKSASIKIERFPTMWLDVTGNYQPIDRRISVDDLTKNYIEARRFFQSIENKEFRDELLISPSQLQQINEVARQFWVEIGSAYQTPVAKPGYSVPTEKQYEKARKTAFQLQNTSGKTTLEKVRSILLKRQWRAYKDHTERTLDKMMGPVYAITKGRIGKEFHLSDREKSTFANNAKKAVSHFQSATRKIEKKWFDFLISDWSTTKSRKAKQLFGQKPKRFQANLAIYRSTF